MSPESPPPEDDATLSLSETEQDELNNRVLSGDADQEDSTDAVELARLGSYVLLEVEEEQHVEKHADEQAAERRYEQLRDEHIEGRGD